ncbi:MAG TPA: molybdopterin cofactor-binding domain-containing protein [Parafilimonas sp.]|nr:molybdopterin cofactor-binding domain-containing protein [Parafilimonas sp.]
MVAKNISRRNFLRNSSLSSAALMLGLYFPVSAKEAAIVNASGSSKEEIELNAWISIDTSGKVTLLTHRAEMGQGAYQSVPQILAEELEVNLADVNIIFAKGDQKKYGSQITGGSSTIRDSYKNLLKLSATARTMLIQTAANKWNVDVADCYAENGFVINKKSGDKLNYGDLVVDASKLTPPTNITLKKRSEYKLIGKPLLRQDAPLKTNGSAIFGIDKKLPGMMYAAVERSPRLRGTVKSFDDTDALKIPGVTKVFKIQFKVFNTTRDGVAVIANSTWAAIQGKKALKVEWNDSGFEHVNTTDIFKTHEVNLKTKDGLVFKTQGNADDILKQATKKIDVIYQTPYQSHSAMEPVNCVANYTDDKIEIWGPIQAPDWVQQFISKEYNLSFEKVIVNMTFLGGGFGRKAFLDYPHEAVVISKEIKAPVQVLWTREDDMTQGPHRPGVSYRCEGVINNGEIDAFKVKLCGQNIDYWSGGNNGKENSSSSEGFLNEYTKSIKNLSIYDVPFETPLPVMWWRSVYASTNGFAYESFMNELAHEAGVDPLQFRRKYLQDERCQKLIDKLEEVSNWKNRNKNEGYGVAITECFASTVGQVVKVSKAVNGGVKIDKVWAVMDCGWYVNPDIIKAQVEGSVIMALGAATIHEITYKDGIPEQQNFYNYQMPRITDIPEIEVFVMDNDADAGGVGEPGLPAFAPALTEAVFDLTGKRIRKLPFSLAEV